MANPKGYITSKQLQKELDKAGDFIAGRACKRVNAAADGVCIVKARSRFHFMFGHGATRALCGTPAKKTPDTVVTSVSVKLLQTTCDKCWLRYKQLLDKAVKIEIDRL